MGAFYPSNLSAIELSAKTWWKEQRFDYDGDGNIIYKGYHTKLGIGASDNLWLIWKMTWTSGSLTRIQGPIEGSWTERTSLGW